MTCAEIHAALEREALGLGGPEETSLLTQHLPRCADCAARAHSVRRRYQDLVGGVAAAAEGLAPLLNTVGDRLEAALDADRPHQRPRPHQHPSPRLRERLRPLLRPALALAGAAAVFLASAFFDGRSDADAVALQRGSNELPSTRLRGLP